MQFNCLCDRSKLLIYLASEAFVIFLELLSLFTVI